MNKEIEKIKKYLRSIDTEICDGKIHIKVSVMPFNDYRCREKIRVGLGDIIQLLAEKKIKHGKCLKDADIQNKRRSSAVWIFEKPIRKAAPPTPNPTRTRKNNSRKSKKVLDNSPKDVIIKETNNSE